MSRTLVEKAMDARNDRRSENAFIKSMEPKVKKVAWKYASSVKGAEEYIEDLENAARMGISKAIHRFDFSFGGFDRYMEESMKIEIRDFLNESIRLIRLPKHMVEAVNRVRRYESTMHNEGKSMAPHILIDEGIVESSGKLKRIREAMKTEEPLSLDWDYSGESDGKMAFSSAIPSENDTEKEYEKRKQKGK